MTYSIRYLNLIVFILSSMFVTPIVGADINALKAKETSRLEKLNKALKDLIASKKGPTRLSPFIGVVVDQIKEALVLQQKTFIYLDLLQKCSSGGELAKDQIDIKAMKAATNKSEGLANQARTYLGDQLKIAKDANMIEALKGARVFVNERIEIIQNHRLYITMLEKCLAEKAKVKPPVQVQKKPVQPEQVTQELFTKRYPNLSATMTFGEFDTIPWKSKPNEMGKVALEIAQVLKDTADLLTQISAENLQGIKRTYVAELNELQALIDMYKNDIAAAEYQKLVNKIAKLRKTYEDFFNATPPVVPAPVMPAGEEVKAPVPTSVQAQKKPAQPEQSMNTNDEEAVFVEPEEEFVIPPTRARGGTVYGR